MILQKVGMDAYFDAVVDGNDITKSKPDPEVFLIAAKRLDIEPWDCLVIEDTRITSYNVCYTKLLRIFAG